MPRFAVPSWTTEEIAKHWGQLYDAVVFDTPDRLGHDLVVWIPSWHLVNLGQITQSALDVGSDRRFFVRTNMSSGLGELSLRLAEGIRATAGLPMEGVRV